MLQLPRSQHLAPTRYIPHMNPPPLSKKKKRNRTVLYRPTRNNVYILTRIFFSFFSQFFRGTVDPLLSLAVIHPPQRVGFFIYIYAVGCTFSAFFSLPSFYPLQVPLTLYSFSYFLAVHVVVVVRPLTPFPHVFLMCSCTHIVLILPPGAVAEEGRRCICCSTQLGDSKKKKRVKRGTQQKKKTRVYVSSTYVHNGI